MPRVTVLMPAYNVGPWIHEAIESVLMQTFTDFSLLVIDDCSTDNTAEVVSSFSDPRIRYEKNPHNLGLADNLNRGLELSDTEFCARMDGDDIAEHTWLETGIKVLDSHPEIGICSFGFKFFGARDSIVRFPEDHEHSKAQMLFGCTIIVPVFRRSVMVENSFKYRTEAFPAEDYDMWSRCYKVTQVYNVQETMFHYHMHSTQISTSKAELQSKKADMVRIDLLDWLSKELTEEDKQFFLKEFVPCRIKNRTQFKQMTDFAKYLECKNQGNFSNQALNDIFNNHIHNSVYNSVIADYFSEGYSLPQYFKYLKSGLEFHISLELNLRILARSILLKK